MSMEETYKSKPTGPSRVTYRRRISLVRTGIITLVTSGILIGFIFWYRDLPQRLDCSRMAQRIAAGLNNYHRTYHRLPNTLEELHVSEGRYTIDHYEYRFLGFGDSADLADGVLVVYCLNPHRSVFSPAWRHVLIAHQGMIVVNRMSEPEFQAMLARQQPAVSF